MSEHEQRPPENQLSMENWCGSSLDGSVTVRLTRCYNGVIVDSGDGSTAWAKNMLVFQDTEKLISWIQEWHKTSRVQR